MAANINQLVQRWKKIDLTQLQLALDETANDLATRQDDSESSRKKLVELSRDFKKNVSDEIRQVVAPLLKSFQNEVDNLSKRSKAAEAAFLTVYKKIIDIPDPVSSLELAAGLHQRALKTQELELENEKLQDTLKEFREEIRDLKNQEITVKQLQGKLKNYEDNLEFSLQEQLKQKEAQWNQAQTESLTTLSAKLEEAEKKIVQLQSALENSQSELLELRSRYDEISHAKLEELEMMMNDLERANQRTVLAEKEMGQLKEKLNATKQSFQSFDQTQKSSSDLDQAKQREMARSTLELELHAKEKQISHLMDDIQRLQSTLAILKESSASKIAQLEDILLEKDKLIQDLEDKLFQQKDYDEIKKELSIFKSMEFSGNNSSNLKQPLEVMLLEKNKSLQSENTSLKVSKTELSGFPLQTVESFGSLLGEEIVTTYTKTHTVVEESVPPASPLPINGDMSDNSPPISETQSPQEPLMSVDQLQEILRHKIENCGEEILNTLSISRCVRELLNAHNIGQRLFAKYVLGLSQGTVSELLSKPKPWDKLTEKGRDSYRKMYAWASDENCVNMLKSLLPKKGKELFTYKQEDEERVAQILRDARAAMCQQEKIQLPEFRDEGGGGKLMNKPNRRPRKYENDDIPPEMVMRIYQEELSKLMGQRLEEGYERTQEEIQQALSIYHQELARLNYHSSNSSSASSTSSVENGPIDASVPSKKWKASNLSSESEKASPPYSSAFPPISIKQEPLEEGSEDSSSPLQRMQSITNSLLAQATTQFTGHRPTKAVLPPITQQQFDQYKNLNTEGIVKKVKEQLSQFSISQRLFGESVLGLSQGSVSDLLARPKPWHMLTQKGREPFIRMQIFLEDENAAHKLVASQYKIAPERLMRTSNFNGNPIVENVPEPREKSPDLSIKITPQKSPLPLSVKSQPSIYEIAAMTTDLDTHSITTQIKETLIAHNIGQKLFGDIVLGLSQGSVSELLSKPKPWHLLSAKGREPFIRMQLWLRDPHNINKLKSIKNEKREVIKRGHADYFLPQEIMPSTKKPRILFSEEQKEALRLAYAIDPYPSSETIDFLSSELNLSVRTVTNWFHNHRMRIKGSPNSKAQIPLPRSFDPSKFRNLLGQRLAEICQEQNDHQMCCSNEDGTLDLSVSSHTIYHDGGSGDECSNSGPSECSESETSRVSEPTNRSKRRKCAMPQRVELEPEKKQPIINGVCVIQAGLKDENL